jgi:hypothetical protein
VAASVISALLNFAVLVKRFSPSLPLGNLMLVGITIWSLELARCFRSNPWRLARQVLLSECAVEYATLLVIMPNDVNITRVLRLSMKTGDLFVENFVTFYFVGTEKNFGLTFIPDL